MANFLQAAIEAISTAKNEQELRSQLLAVGMSEYFSATRCGLCFFDQFDLTDTKLRKILDVALSIERNPIARYLVEHHAPVSESLVTSPKVWQLICPRADHWHVMAGPIVSYGQLIGIVGVTRCLGMSAFDSQNLTDLSALCLHISTWATIERSHQQASSHQFPSVFKHALLRLTPREVQIAQLVAQGLTNAEIGAELWITENSVKQALKRMFRKLEVSSRAEMVGQLWAQRDSYSNL